MAFNAVSERPYAQPPWGVRQDDQHWVKWQETHHGEKIAVTVLCKNRIYGKNAGNLQTVLYWNVICLL